MDEEVVESIPTETMESDDDFFSDVDSEVIAGDITEGGSQSSEGEEDNEAEVPSEASEDNSQTEKEVDLTPLLKALSGKIKYNKEEVNVESIEDLITNVQKGLNYDKKVQEVENLQNGKALSYVTKKAQELGMTVDEYMDQVEDYEKKQEEERNQAKFEDMVNSGVPEDVAKEVIATSQLRKQLQAKENELKEKEEAQKKEADKNREYEEFLREFPDVNPEDIPKEVFEDAQNSNLTNAYMKWKVKELEKQISINKTNEKNKESSVGSTTETGTTSEKHERDFFLEGFNE